MELVERLEATLGELRRQVENGDPDNNGSSKAFEAFADEMFRARDA